MRIAQLLQASRRSYQRSRCRTLLAAAALAASALVAQSARAESVGPDVVNLKDGGFIRGTVVSVEPGSHVMVLEYGKEKPRSVPWGTVADVQRGKAAGKSEPASTSGDDAVPLPDLEEAEPKASTRKVYIETEAAAELYQVVAAGSIAVPNGVAFFSQAKSVCVAPCGEPIDLEGGNYFYLAGEGFPGSRHFRLDPGKDPITVELTPGSTGGIIGGITLLSLGGASILAGGPLLLLAGIGDYGTGMLAGGAIALSVGAAGLAIGIPLLMGNTTKVELREGAPGAQGDDEQQAASLSFERDRRPSERAPRYWLGEF